MNFGEIQAKLEELVVKVKPDRAEVYKSAAKRLHAYKVVLLTAALTAKAVSAAAGLFVSGVHAAGEDSAALA